MISATTSRFAHWALSAVLMFSMAVTAEEWVYAVVPGDNLWEFSEEHLDSVLRFEELRRLNNITDPENLRPGTRIRVPMEWIPASVAAPAYVHAIAGTGSVRHANGETVDATAGLELRLGDSVRAHADSSLALRFADDSMLSLHADSEVRLDHLSARGKTGMVDTRLNLLRGRLDTRVKPAVGPASRFEIHTPSAISAVRGTEYRALVSPDGQASNIEVLEGSVAVEAQQAQVLVPLGYGTQAEKGKAPVAPRELLPAPTLQAPVIAIRTRDWILRWDALDGATDYRVELSREPAFNTVLWQTLTANTALSMPALDDGEYFLRVRARDERTLEGISARAAVVVDASPLAPKSVAPQDGAVLRGSGPRLRWAPSSEAARYRLEIAAAADFSTLLVSDESLAATGFDATSLREHGRYYWRVTSIAADGEVGPAGSVQHFTIEPMPEPKVSDNRWFAAFFMLLTAIAVF